MVDYIVSVVSEDYISKLPLNNLLHASRHFRKAKDGGHIPKKYRIFVPKKIGLIVRLVPLDFQLYYDDGIYFFDLRELKKWKEWDKYKDLILKVSLENEIKYLNSKVRNVRNEINSLRNSNESK